MTRGQTLGCLGLAALSAALALMSLVLGLICLSKEGLWNCAALLTIVPGGLLVIAYGAGWVATQADSERRREEDIGYQRMAGDRQDGPDQGADGEQ